MAVAGNESASDAYGSMTDQLLTIAQAAARLGLSERTLRRTLREPEHQAKLQAITRQIGGRVRQVSMIDGDHLRCLQRQYASGKLLAMQQAATGVSPAALLQAYERLVEEQAERIADLHRALEYELEQSRRHAAAAAEARGLLESALQQSRREPFWRRPFSKSGTK